MMRAMVFEKYGTPLVKRMLPIPKPSAGQLLLQVEACGVCRTDLHVVDGDGQLNNAKFPLIPGHQVVARVAEVGGSGKTSSSSSPSSSAFKVGQRVGVPWLFHSCMCCKFCTSEPTRENLCEKCELTGYQVDGGYAEYMISSADDFTLPLPETLPATKLAPLMCAGIIGYRSLRFTGADSKTLGFYGFGAAAHLLCQVATFQGKQVYAFTKPGDVETQVFARKLGAVWAGGADELPPCKLDAAILFAPVGDHVPAALKAVDRGGRVVCAGIHMSDIPSFPYEILWSERSIHSVANVTRADGKEFLPLVAKIPGFDPEVTAYPLEKANEALSDLRNGRYRGAGVLDMSL